MSLKYKLVVVFTILFFVILIDQATKYWAVQTMMGQSPRYYLGEFFQFVYAENPGAFLGLGGGLSHQLRFIIFAVLVVLGLGGMLWYLLKKETSKVNLIAYSFILAGGFGNLWDRVVHENGHVVDFMLIEVVGPLRTGVFNVADMAIVAGVILALCGEYYFDGRKDKKAK
ncbi:MAG: signal peptidase II [Bdellovibrio sp.]|nr:signal peptidase II [Bdellovibrio sp.]